MHNTILLASLLGMAQIGADLPYPYNTIEVRPFNPEGFFNNPNVLRTLFEIHKPKVVIEVGSWMGQSTRHMAGMLPPGGTLYAVDHWLGSQEHQPGQVFWSPHLPYLYEQFLSNIIHAELTDIVVPIRMPSLEARKELADVKADFIYIDASHDYDAVYADLNAWFPLVKGNGVFCGDDWGYPPINQAVARFAEENNLSIETPGEALWILRENTP